MENKLKVNHVNIKNVLGITQFEMSPSQITLISGKNGHNKTSLLTSIQTALNGGSLVSIKNKDADDKDCEVALMLSSDERKVSIDKKGKNLTVKKENQLGVFEKISSPQKFLNDLLDKEKVNPVLFIKASDKERVNMMLNSIRLNYSRDELLKQLSWTPDFVPDGLTEIEEIEFIRSKIFDYRTDVNRDKKANQLSYEKLLQNIPENNYDGEEFERVSEVYRQLSKDITERESRFEAELIGKKKDIEQKHEDEKRKINQAHDKNVASIKDVADKKINDLKAEIKKIEDEQREMSQKLFDEMVNKGIELNAQKTQEFELLQGEINNAHNSLQSDKDDLLKVEHEIDKLNTLKELSIKAEGLKQQALEFKNEADEYDKESRELTESLEYLDRYKGQILSDLPVDGLTIEGNKIIVNGVPFDQLNTAQQISVAVKIVTFDIASDLPILFIDGIEALDSENFKVLVEELKRIKNLQCFLGKVSDDSLKVEAV